MSSRTTATCSGVRMSVLPISRNIPQGRSSLSEASMKEPVSELRTTSKSPGKASAKPRSREPARCSSSKPSSSRSTGHFEG